MIREVVRLVVSTLVDAVLMVELLSLVQLILTCYIQLWPERTQYADRTISDNCLRATILAHPPKSCIPTPGSSPLNLLSLSELLYLTRPGSKLQAGFELP